MLRPGWQGAVGLRQVDGMPHEARTGGGRLRGWSDGRPRFTPAIERQQPADDRCRITDRVGSRRRPWGTTADVRHPREKLILFRRVHGRGGGRLEPGRPSEDELARRSLHGPVICY